MKKNMMAARVYFKTLFAEKWHWILAIFIFILSTTLSWIYYPDDHSEQSNYFATIFSGFGVIIFGASTFILDIERRKESKNEIIKLKRGFDLSIKQVSLQITIYKFDDQNKFLILPQPTLSVVTVTVEVTSYINNQINLTLLPLGNSFSNAIIPQTITIKPHTDKESFHIFYKTGYNPLADERSSKNLDVQIKLWRTSSSYGVDRNIEPNRITVSHSHESLYLADGKKGIRKQSGSTSVNKEFNSLEEVQKYYKNWEEFSKKGITTITNEDLKGNININLLRIYDAFCKNQELSNAIYK